MSRYRRKYLSKRVIESSSNKIYRYARASTISEDPQQTSDILGFDTLTDWGLANNAYSIYDFDPVSPTKDKAFNNGIIVPGVGTTFDSTNLKGLIGSFEMLNNLSNKSSASISNFQFGRAQDRTIILVAKIPVVGNDYIGGPGIEGDTDAFFQAAYNSNRGRAIISYGTSTSGADLTHQNWISVADSGKLCITMIRWKELGGTGNFFVTYKVIDEEAQSSALLLPISSGTDVADTFWFGAIGGGNTSTAGTKFYWLGFFNEYLSNDDFDAAVQILGI